MYPEDEAKIKAAIQARDYAGAEKALTSMSAGRELTVGELIDRRIDKLDRQARDLRSLKDAMSQGFLQSGASRIQSLLEL